MRVKLYIKQIKAINVNPEKRPTAHKCKQYIHSYEVSSKFNPIFSEPFIGVVGPSSSSSYTHGIFFRFNCWKFETHQYRNISAETLEWRRWRFTSICVFCEDEKTTAQWQDETSEKKNKSSKWKWHMFSLGFQWNDDCVYSNVSPNIQLPCSSSMSASASINLKMICLSSEFCSLPGSIHTRTWILGSTTIFRAVKILKRFLGLWRKVFFWI